MAFVQFTTTFSDHYIPEHRIVKMVVTCSDNTEIHPHMTIVTIINSDGVLEENMFYGEPRFP